MHEASAGTVSADQSKSICSFPAVSTMELASSGSWTGAETVIGVARLKSIEWTMAAYRLASLSLTNRKRRVRWDAPIFSRLGNVLTGNTGGVSNRLWGRVS